MQTTVTTKGQVTIPKQIRKALHLVAGSHVEFNVNQEGQVVLQRAAAQTRSRILKDRFEAVRGKADIKWRTDDLMALLRDAH